MSTKSSLCPICEKGTLSTATHTLEIKHGDNMIVVPDLEHSVCDSCGEEPVMTEQIRRNQLKIADAKRRSDGLLTGAEVCLIREQLGLTQQQARVLFGGGANAFSKYERGDVIQSVAMDRLLKAAAFIPDVVEFLEIEARVASTRLPDSTYAAVSATNLMDSAFTSKSVQGHLVEVHSAKWEREAA